MVFLAFPFLILYIDTMASLAACIDTVGLWMAILSGFISKWCVPSLSSSTDIANPLLIFDTATTQDIACIWCSDPQATRSFLVLDTVTYVASIHSTTSRSSINAENFSLSSPFSRYLSRYDRHQNEYFCCMLVTWVIVFISPHVHQETNSHLLHPPGVFPQQWTCHLPVRGLKPACVDRRSPHHIHIHTTCALVRRRRSGFPQLLKKLEKSFRRKNIVKWKILFDEKLQRLQTIMSSTSHFWLRWFYLPTSRCDFSFNPPVFLMQFIRSPR